MRVSLKDVCSIDRSIDTGAFQAAATAAFFCDKRRDNTFLKREEGTKTFICVRARFDRLININVVEEEGESVFLLPRTDAWDVRLPVQRAVETEG